MRRSARILAATCLLFAARAEAAPQASFSVSRVDGVAPLAVLFDAGGTSDPSVSRPFHDLKYEWDFGDPDAGVWAVSSRPNHSKNYELGPVTGHVFDPDAADYAGGQKQFTVTLTVTNPNGESASTTRTVTVTDPDAYFPGNATTCVSSSGNFSGCPAGARQVTSSDFDDSLDRSANRRTLYRRGDTFAQGQTILPGLGNAHSQIGAYGGSATRPVVTSSLPMFGASMFMHTGWTLSGLDFAGNGGTAHRGPAGVNIRRITIYDVRVTGFHQCATWNSPSAPADPEEIAVVDFSCTESRGADTAYFGRNNNSMFMGLHVDVGRLGSTEFAWRSVHLDTVAIQHNYFTGTTNGRASVNFRTCTLGATACNGPQERVNFSDNHVHQTDGSGYFLRFCGESACDWDAQPLQTSDFLIERNYWSADYTFPTTQATYLQRWIWLMGEDMTVRNNVVNLSTVPSGPPIQMVHLAEDSRLSYDRIHVLHNTFYMGQGWDGNVTLCYGSQGGDKRCQGNLLYAPGLDGTRIVSNGSWTTSGNLMDGSTAAGRYTGNPFVGAGFDSADDFALSGSVAGGTSPVDASGTASGVQLDFFQGCRSGAPDAGADEFGASPCPPTPDVGGLQPPDPPILLP